MEIVTDFAQALAGRCVAYYFFQVPFQRIQIELVHGELSPNVTLDSDAIRMSVGIVRRSTGDDLIYTKVTAAVVQIARMFEVDHLAAIENAWIEKVYSANGVLGADRLEADEQAKRLASQVGNHPDFSAAVDILARRLSAGGPLFPYDLSMCLNSEFSGRFNDFHGPVPEDEDVRVAAFYLWQHRGFLVGRHIADWESAKSSLTFATSLTKASQSNSTRP